MGANCVMSMSRRLTGLLSKSRDYIFWDERGMAITTLGYVYQWGGMIKDKESREYYKRVRELVGAVLEERGSLTDYQYDALGFVFDSERGSWVKP